MRPGLTFIGLAMAACGAAALCVGLGGLGPSPAGRPVLDPAMSRLAAGPPWFWPGVAGLSVSLTLVGLLWLFAQGRAAVLRRLNLTRWSTRVRVRVAADDLVEEVRRLPGVQSVQVRLTGSAAWSRFVVSVVCDEDADLTLLRGHLSEDSLVRLRTELEMYELPTIVRFRLVCP
ncbi:hypothetical protein [Actinomadura sp. HBU206391]|uniref:hypothetical protein n=1 Tax=Actinomadura sp. HBU206391 TaxID=2731692 RepID=UPI001650BAAF|nr:hypothetical protein [Actinomadura sp. HBU206391]MBC6460428.1 hypothetical protein [Actinomadura sp. HBU206391]